MKKIAVDLHVHSLLSPCAGNEMTPPRVLERAVEKGLGLIAITDHNSALNVPAFCQAAGDLPLEVVPGMEVQTREDVHLICLFDTVEKLFCLQEIVNKTLPGVKNRAEYFGEQLIVDEKGKVTGVEKRLLLNSLNLSIDETVVEVVRLGGICIAAHVDRQAFGLLGVLGFIPPELPLAALELSRREAVAGLYRTYGDLKGYPLIFASDAHYLADVGRNTTLMPQEVSNAESLVGYFKGGCEGKGKSID
ncbi:MAG TPA: PHP domain-containing protein [Clostridia bacterium]|nr:PHP domain-containing protein [Clostridia bacterium]